MALFVFITDNCRADMATHSFVSEVERFCERIETTQNTDQFDPFPPPYLVKKKIGGRQGRLICDLRTVDDHAVVVFLAILIRGGRDYEDQFVKDPRGYGQQHFADLVSQEQLVEYVSLRTKTSPPQMKPQPSECEFGLLYGAFGHHQDTASDDLICETKEWVEQVTEDRISKQLVLFCPLCLTALTMDHGLHFIPVPGKRGWGIWVYRIQGRLLLITPVTDASVDKSEALAKRIAEELNGKAATDVLRASRRAYPAIILADDELWIDLEKEPVANMALSPEESEVLESARKSEHPFPLFINGRAGSGKSTILQYLFADLLFYYLSTPGSRSMAPPVYLTANSDLLRVARGFVERLLQSGATFSQQSGGDLIDDNRDLLGDAFRQFQPHLLSMIDPEERNRRFARAARVDYTSFRRMWMERFGHEKQAIREFGPDLSWHIIRSYIKGMSSETYLEPDDYAQLPENQITVSHQAFKLVYDRVWTGWYQRILEDESLWDDQDLTRYIVDHDLAKPIYPAVFCDEAQDFTRLELELLLRLNLFSNRTLPPNNISRVPFAFAGDQFQTLNPTGFRWDSIKASFVEKFIFALDPARRSGRTDLNYRELKFNYRSTHKIVRFSNHIQALRAALFRLPDLKPQTPWTSEPRSFPVAWFRSNDALFWKKFREIEGFIIIVPCSEGEEFDFVQNDPFLREHVRTEEGVPLNVLSPGRAKGCEYPAVIVYGFGAAESMEIVTRLESNGDSTPSDPEKTLPMQYFINRLYVAISRPKRRLIVIDTDDGFARLWKCAQNEGAESLMLSRIKNGRQVWGSEIEGMSVGNVDDLTRESAGDPLENAKTFEADGLARQDAFMLTQAAISYRSGGDNAKANECRARAFEADGQLLSAGEAYFESGFVIPDGVRCLWRAGRDGWKELCTKLSQNPQIQKELEFEWARGIINRVASTDVVNILAKFAKRLDDPKFAESCAAEPIWRDAISALLKPLLEQKQPAVAPESWNHLVSSLGRIRAMGVGIPSSTCAPVFFQAQRFSEAIAMWDDAGDTKSNEYLRAKANVEHYPQRIISLAKLDLAAEIVDAYSDNQEIALNQEQVIATIDAFRKVNRREEAYILAWKSSAFSPMFRLVIDAMHKGAQPEAVRALHAGFIILVKQKQWDSLGTFLATREFAPSAEWREAPLKSLVESNLDGIQSTLVRALARSEELVDSPSHVQRQISDFLKGYLRVKDGQWRKSLSIQEAGAAIERAGRFTDAFAFYEALIKEKGGQDEKRFAQLRWLVCKQRQLDHERPQAAVRRVNDIERELKQKMGELRLKTLDELDAFPGLQALQLPVLVSEEGDGQTHQPSTQPTIKESTANETISLLPDRVEIAVGKLKIELSRKKSRCNITHVETMETAFFKISDRKCGGEVEFVEDETARWVCATWKVTVHFPKTNGDVLAIALSESGIMLQLEL